MASAVLTSNVNGPDSPLQTDNFTASIPEKVVSTNEGKVKKLIKRKRKPARPQVDPADVKSEPPPQTGIVFNIWYNKWSGGDREDKYLSQTHAKGRCVISTDTGYTRADKILGSYFCLFFAKGLCPKGQDCEYLHRLPGIHDHYNPNIDCFGRSKHNEYRDDMGGVGSFMRQNRTLYVGRIVVNDDIEEVVARHFQEWGELERIRVLTGRGVAFVTYLNEANAQFAKEAMAHQSLDNDEILNVRWATADPNPLAQKREARAVEEQAAEAVRRALPADFVAEIEGKEWEGSKRRKTEGTFGLEGYNVPDKVWYGTARPKAVQPGSVSEEIPETVEGSKTHVPTEPIPYATAATQGDDSLIGLATASAYKKLAAARTERSSQASPKRLDLLVGYASGDDSD